MGKHWKQQQTILGGLEITAGDGCLHELKTNGKMTESKLKKESGLGSAEFYSALGWLAREGKLNLETEVKGSKTCEYYSLNA